MASSSSGPSVLLFPIALLVMITAAGVFVVMKNQEQLAEEQQAVEPEPSSSPFDDLPEETPPVRGSSSGSSRSSSSGGVQIAEMPDLSGNALAEMEPWVSAALAAERADLLFEAALAAREESRWSEFKQQGGEALRTYEEIYDATAEYEAQVIAAHGDRDSDVRGIVRARSFWGERRATLRKIVR